MYKRLMLGISVLLVLLLAACSGPTDTAATTPPPTHPTTQATSTPTKTQPTTDAPSTPTAPTTTPPASEEPTETTSPQYPEQPPGEPDPNLVVAIYDPAKACNGTTLLPLNYDSANRRLVEVNMLGEIIWEYQVPENGFTDVELLPGGNLLYTVGGQGIYEIDRDGNKVWSYPTSRADHDADRLPNGNTLFVCAADYSKSDAQVTEIDSSGQIVWQWYAKDHFDVPPYADIVSGEGDWTHTNAVSRLANGNTLISLRNFNLLAEVDAPGDVVRVIGEGILIQPHDPVILPDGNILVASQDIPEQRAKEIDPTTDAVVWQSPGFGPESYPVRDANLLPNGNILITAADRVVEVTPEGEVVWQLVLEGVTFYPPSGFYKAERIPR
jgi:hypothetical protein